MPEEQLGDIKAKSIVEWVANDKVRRTIVKQFSNFLKTYVDDKGETHLPLLTFTAFTAWAARFTELGCEGTQLSGVLYEDGASDRALCRPDRSKS